MRKSVYLVLQSKLPFSPLKNSKCHPSYCSSNIQTNMLFVWWQKLDEMRWNKLLIWHVCSLILLISFFRVSKFSFPFCSVEENFFLLANVCSISEPWDGRNVWKELAMSLFGHFAIRFHASDVAPNNSKSSYNPHIIERRWASTLFKNISKVKDKNPRPSPSSHNTCFHSQLFSRAERIRKPFISRNWIE